MNRTEESNIRVRNQRFARSPMARKWWLGGDPVATAFYNSLSTTFPPGEKFSVETIRHFREGAGPELAGDMAAFIKQEMSHTREHMVFNRRVTESGYDISKLEEQIDTHFGLMRKKPKIEGLAAVVAIEHLTASFAHQILTNPNHLRNASADDHELWRWHSMEEIEHKGVAYDTWLLATKDWGRLKRWYVKSKAMLSVSYTFITNRTAGALELLKQDGLTGPGIWKSYAWFALVYPGMFRHILGAYLKFFMPGFHPWNIDNRALIDESIHVSVSPIFLPAPGKACSTEAPTQNSTTLP